MTVRTKIVAFVLAIATVFIGLTACGETQVIDSKQENLPQSPIKSYEEKTVFTYSENGDYFFSTTEIPTFQTLEVKDVQGLRLSSLNSKFSFGANCEGDVKLFVWTSGVESQDNSVTVKITIDGTQEKTYRWVSAGTSIPIATGLSSGDHTFTVEKISGGANLYIGYVTLFGELLEPSLSAVENGVWVEVLSRASSGHEFLSFNVYTQTTHPSGEYFIKYNFAYEQNAVRDDLTWSTGADTGANRSNFRIRTAQIVKKSGSDFITLYEILQSGEISLAIKEINPETGEKAGDFVGGFHGDENLYSARLILDGKKSIDLFDSEPALYNCTTVEFKQLSVIDRCHTAECNVINHNQYYLIDTNGIRLNQQVKWLTGDFTPLIESTYLQMFTLNRFNPDNQNEFLTTKVNLLDKNGVAISSLDLTAVDVGEKLSVVADQSSKARYAEYFGTEKGIYAKVGFQLVDNSCTLYNASIKVRKFGDSKWYASFKSENSTPAVGEVWNVNCFYYIDYNPS